MLHKLPVKKMQLCNFLSSQSYYIPTYRENQTNQPKAFDEIPQPKGLPLLGTFLDRTPLRNFDPSRFHVFVAKRHKDVGPIYRESLMGKLVVFTSAPEDVETMFRLNERFPDRPKMEPLARGRQLLNRDEGITNLKGEDWYRVRQLYNNHLLTNKSIWNYTKKHLEISFDLINYMEKNFDENREIPEFDHVLHRWALECATLFATDTKMGVFKTDLMDDTKLLIESTLNIISTWGKMYTSIPLWKYFNTKLVKQLKSYQENQIFALNQYINRTSNHASKLQAMISESDLQQKEKFVVLLDILGAGVDTTSNAASFVLYCLATNPEKQDILRQEIKQATNSEQEISGRALQQIRYLYAVNMEAQRLYPLTIGFIRITPTNMVLSGYHVPAGTQVMFTANTMNNRDPKYFDDPDSFIPERWLNRNQENKFVMSGSFGMGARMCPGRRFALQEVGCLTIALLSRYKVEYHHEPFEIAFNMLNKPAQKSKFKFIPLEK